MKYTTMPGFVLLAALLSTATFAMAQDTTKVIKKVPIERTSAGSGDEMFNAYCAACHGKTAKGDGPAASELKIPPADLTTLAQRNNGKFPIDYVTHVLEQGVQEAKAHGSKDMPIWGPLFGSISGGSASPEVKQRIYNLSKYIESLQGK